MSLVPRVATKSCFSWAPTAERSCVLLGCLAVPGLPALKSELPLGGSSNERGRERLVNICAGAPVARAGKSACERGEPFHDMQHVTTTALCGPQATRNGVPGHAEGLLLSGIKRSFYLCGCEAAQCSPTPGLGRGKTTCEGLYIRGCKLNE
jgi:hypothetical protein